jgi:orotate phosphoribosyltransferase
VYKRRRTLPASAELAAKLYFARIFAGRISAMSEFRREFLAFALAREVLRFGQFTTKAGRSSPYFFNAGLFNDGDSLRKVGTFYAQALEASGLVCDQLFGPAYKGIPLASATAIALSQLGHNLPWSFNRKEAKDHGEGGVVVGAPLKGRVLIVDDVITAGTSVRESVEIIRAHGANPAGVLIALDRMERGQADASAVQEVQASYGIPVVAIATLDDLMAFLADRPELRAQADSVAAYRERYGARNG